MFLRYLPARQNHARQAPPRWLGHCICRILNQLFRAALRAGDFDFLQSRCLAICVRDLPLQLPLGLKAGHFVVVQVGAPDATISANAIDFFRLALGLEDPDSLFFQRRLCIDGDTALGLQAKNTLDAFELPRLPTALHRQLKKLMQERGAPPWN